MGIGTSAMTGAAQQFLQGRQSQQQMEQKMQMELRLTLLKEQLKLKAQNEARIANLKIFQQMQSQGQFNGMNVNVGGNLSMKPIKPEERGLREQPIAPMKNPLEYLMGLKTTPGMKTPQEIQAEQFQQRAGIFQRAQGIPSPQMPRGASAQPGLRPQPDQIRRALLARGQRQRLGPQFGGRPISQTTTGQYSVGAPRAQSFLEKLPPITNEQIVTKKGFLGMGRQTEPRWTANEFKVIQNINTKEDLAELRRDWQKYQRADVNAQKIIDWFMIPTNLAGTRGRLGTL